MSLILDALEQADHERRGQPPAAPPGDMPVQPASALKAASSREAGLWWVACGAALALAGVLAWERWGLAPPAAVVQRPMAADTTRLPALPMAPPPAVSKAPSAGVVPPAPAATSEPLFAPPPPAAAPPSPEAPAAALADDTAARAVPFAPPTAAAAPPQANRAPPIEQPTATVSPTLPTVGELPAPTRERLPSLTITGHTYSDNPTLRTLMIDGRMLVEGQTLAPGLRLERIERHQAVFNQGGTRFSVGY